VQDVTPSGQTSGKYDDVPDATTSVMQENLGSATVPETPEDVSITGNDKSPDRLLTDNEENWSEDHTVVNSHSDE
ncbi:hypothetical protein A2U01_0102280, partial [Trifolium medium]|nr:hypothetical protein [Trifolium medium]